jgi:hypothetical protein
MTLIEQIQNQVRQLPPEKQKEALDFIAFLKQRSKQPVSSETDRRNASRKRFQHWQN